MTHMIEAFLAAEFSCFPQVLDKYVGKYYSTKISNGATWLFFMWHVVHFLFEESINLLMKQMKVKEYVRVRLKHSIWYLGFYTVCFAYCIGTLYNNNVDVFSHRKLLAGDNEMVPGYLILGFVVLCTFYAHSVTWEGLKKGFSVSSVSYMLLMIFILATYFSRKVELSLSLLAIVSFTQFGIELARCSYTLLKSDGIIMDFVMKGILGLAVTLFILTHLFIIPLFFLFPLMYSFLWESQSNSIVAFNVILWLWLFCEVLNNPLYKLIRHWLDHTSTTSRTICPGSAVECALFQTRDDEAYNMQIIRREIKEREARMIALRKPKSRSMLLQTLKCMVAIKRKIKEKRTGGESSDSDSEPSEAETQCCDAERRSDEDDVSDPEDERSRLVGAGRSVAIETKFRVARDAEAGRESAIDMSDPQGEVA